jgi:two-component system, LytTR family, response regulator
MKISSFIVDDDADSRIIIRDFIDTNIPEIVITGEAGSVDESIRFIKKQKPDLLLLDISLPDGTAFDLLRQLPERNFEVIFITAYDKFAIEAFKFSAIDYLLKPVAFPEFKEALGRVRTRINEKYFNTHWIALTHNLQSKDLYEKRLAVATAGGYIFIEVSEIVRLESHSNYTHFYFKNDKKLIASQTLGYYEGLLSAEKFCRIHHSHIVNIHFIDRYIKEGAGGTVIMKDGLELYVSQRRKEFFLQQLIKKPG